MYIYFKYNKFFLFYYSILNIIFNNYMDYLLIIIIFISFFNYSKNFNEILIITLAYNSNDLMDIDLTINSILNQSVEQKLYKILLIISVNGINSKLILPKQIKSLKKLKKIRIIIIKKELNLQTKLIIAIKEYPQNPILIINNKVVFPEGWLEMMINDHRKYPNDIISGSIQYFFGKDLKIKQFSEGYNSKDFGKFNHITNMIFNFAILNTNLGGTLYPANSLKNKNFFNIKLFLKISKESDEFWQSCFIFIENRNIRQSSKIYDYTKYIINNKNFINNKIILYEKIKKKFLNFFPWFKNMIEFRQRKVLISLTSYPQRFEFLPIVLKSIENESLLARKIILVLYEKDLLKFNKNNSEINGVDIIVVNKDLKPHKKYYYTMMKYRDYAIITIDDDIFYCKNMIKSLYYYYIDHPNLVAGRRGRLMKYKNNGELINYMNWDLNFKDNKSGFNILLTGIGGIIYPPDILNINQDNLDIINETLLGDDFTLKYFQIKKGIEQKIIHNNHPSGLKILLNSKTKPLFFINKFKNNLYMKKINIIIENEIIKNLCVNYKDIKTGIIIYLFNINNINIINNNTLTIFNIDAYSYCPIDYKIKFNVFFNKTISTCSFNYSYSIIEKNFKFYNTTKILRAFCLINKKVKNLNDFYFPKVISTNNLTMKIYNRHKYIPIIFKNFYILNSKNYILQLLFYKTVKKGYNIKIKINNCNFKCILKEKILYLNDEVPIIKNLECHKIKNNVNNDEIYIAGLPKSLWVYSKKNDDIPNQFIIKKIYKDLIENKEYIIIKGKLYNDLNIDMFNLKINFFSPKLSLYCFIKSTKKYIQAYIYCLDKTKINEEIVIENQIIYTDNYDLCLLIVNNETFLQNYNILNNEKIYNYCDSILLKLFIKDKNLFYIYLLILFIFLIKKVNINIKNYKKSS